MVPGNPALSRDAGFFNARSQKFPGKFSDAPPISQENETWKKRRGRSNIEPSGNSGWFESTAEDPMNYRYRKKPVVIEAFQMTEARRESNCDWPEWLNHAWQLERGTPGSLYPTHSDNATRKLSVGTLEGPMLVSWGDWIIRGVRGEIYPCKDEIFRATYDPVSEDLLTD
jgi:hypothetical protein